MMMLLDGDDDEDDNEDDEDVKPPWSFFLNTETKLLPCLPPPSPPEDA